MIENLAATLQAYQDVYAAKPEEGRSPQWPAVRKAWLAEHPTCAACGATDCLEVHHVLPFHVYPKLELVTSNFISLCEKPGHDCHFRSHGFNWLTWDKNAKENVAAFAKLLDKIRRTGSR